MDGAWLEPFGFLKTEICSGQTDLEEEDYNGWGKERIKKARIPLFAQFAVMFRLCKMSLTLRP